MLNSTFDDYQRICKLGEGTFGVVYKAIQRKTGKFVALKKIKLEHEDNGISSTTLREIAVLRELQHECIVQLFDIVFQDSDNLQLVFEFAEADLKRHMDKFPKGLPSDYIQKYMFQLLSGISFCHRRRIMHRDLKPQNLLIDHEGQLKIADFGLARCFGIPMSAYTHEVVTLWYRAPEILLGSQTYGVSVDIWSIGCIFAEMAKNSPLFTGDAEIDQLFKIFEIMSTPNEENWPGVSQLPDWKPHFPQWQKSDLNCLFPRLDHLGLNLLECLLTYYPGTRISAKAAIFHPYFGDVDMHDGHY